MSAVTTINTDMAAAAVYMKAENWAAAKPLIASSWILITSLPSESRKGDSELRWTPEDIRKALEYVDAQVRAASASASTDVAGMRQTKITWGNVTP